MENLYRVMLSEKKTIASKKAFLTRSEKQQRMYIADLKECGGRSGWYHGERITNKMIREANDELKLILTLREELA